MAKDKIRKGRVKGTGIRPVHLYEDRDGVPVLVAAPYRPVMTVEITDGPDAGRLVDVILPSCAAQTLSEFLVTHAAQATDMNAMGGSRDPQEADTQG